MSAFEHHFRRACEKLKKSDAIIIGAGAGLSASAGLLYSGPDFEEKFSDYIKKYGFQDLYSSGFYPFPSEEERWAYWARHVDFARFQPPALPLYMDLKKLVRKRQYFIITTNVDGQFYKAGFNMEKIFAVQGDYAEMQCSRACHPVVYDNSETVKKILANTHELTIDPHLLPLCPVCGGAMDMHLRKDQFFIEDEHWIRMAFNYEHFLETYAHGHIFLLEIGVGFNTPSIIRYPFEALARINQKATLVRINPDTSDSDRETPPNCISIRTDAKFAIERLLACSTSSVEAIF